MESGDNMSKAGAERLKVKLETYWRQRGFDVVVVLREGGFHPSIRSTRFDVRSDMINGYPRRILGDAEPAGE